MRKDRKLSGNDERESKEEFLDCNNEGMEMAEIPKNLDTYNTSN